MHVIEYRNIREFPGHVVGEDGSVWSYWQSGGPRGSGRGCRTIGDNKWQISYRNDPDGYVRVRFSVEGRRINKKTAILVLQYFVGPRPTPQHHAAHKDGNKKNNHLSNLYWATPKQNTADRVKHGTMRMPSPSHPGASNGRAKLTETNIRSIRKSYSNGNITQQMLADKFGVSDVLISLIVRLKVWGHVV